MAKNPKKPSDPKEERKKALLATVDNDTRYEPLIDDMVYLESELERLRELPKIVVHPKDPTKQKPTPAARMYRDALAQYSNIVRILTRATANDGDEETSPLREWLKSRTRTEV